MSENCQQGRLEGCCSPNGHSRKLLAGIQPAASFPESRRRIAEWRDTVSSDRLQDRLKPPDTNAWLCLSPRCLPKETWLATFRT